ncbi:MAG: secretin N-terminal domain-containing protein, partial [Planctomycetota bacterium]
MLKRTHIFALACGIASCLLPASPAQGQEDLDDLRRRVEQVETQLSDHLTAEDKLATDPQSLRTLVQQAFEARQSLHRAQLRLMEKRVELLKSDIDRRDALADQIIDKRVKDLLRGQGQTGSTDAMLDGGHEPETEPAEGNAGDSHDDGGEQPNVTQAGEKKLAVFYLNHIKAEDAFQLLSDFTSDQDSIRLARDDRLNSLLIQADQARLEQLQEFIQIIDAPAEDTSDANEPSDESIFSVDGAIIKQYQVRGNRDAIIKGLIN